MGNWLHFKVILPISVYRINRRGPNTISCGTPETNGSHPLVAPSTTTLCLRSERNSTNNHTATYTPIDLNLNKGPLWVTLSKAALYSQAERYKTPCLHRRTSEGDEIWYALHQCSPELLYKQTEQQAKKNVSLKNWGACEKLTSHKP